MREQGVEVAGDLPDSSLLDAWIAAGDKARTHESIVGAFDLYAPPEEIRRMLDEEEER